MRGKTIGAALLLGAAAAAFAPAAARAQVRADTARGRQPPPADSATRARQRAPADSARSRNP
ncbi:MAG TPA: hypothetical protein VM890_07750, partial [Longimicrobium sp.]|nr:hypothetical protein [Longimicrobium sp.]